MSFYILGNVSDVHSSSYPGISRAILRSAAIILLVVSCAGCIGVGVVVSDEDIVTRPVPRGNPEHRWACQVPSDVISISHLQGEHFVDAWGLPEEKIVDAAGEIWIYQDSNNWCGLVLGLGIPIPLILPVCNSYDQVSFDNEGNAISSKSRRIDWWGVGLFSVTPDLVGVGLIRPGKLHEADANVFVGLPRHTPELCEPYPFAEPSTED